VRRLTAPVDQGLSLPDQVTAPELAGVGPEQPGEFVDRGLDGEDRLRQAVASKRPCRERARVDGTRVDTLVRAAVRGDRLLDRVV
jgi:hypothetical protein